MECIKGTDPYVELIGQWIIAYEKDLLRLCCAYLGDVSLAEDAVQETFLKAYRHIQSFRGNSSPQTWLIRIAINACKDISRTAWFRMRSKTSDLNGVHIIAPEGNHEIHSTLVAGIMCLPRVCKEVILLHYYEGLTQTEIAEALHVSITTVHRRLEKAYSILRIELKGEL